ncbi:PD-(D/E)XK nuclease superfamily protein [Dyadobacter jejuensis]|uniref:PD-(D/E)XK nuclease superfamily protein n=1 Tax=Dyadobacter jejuensis TaxID=1082580 RepID=A0A316AK07_9BACT|nr:PD-(D/E)XK nuclease family protein [Dyadobacter jejuensis]PWJ57324.1 PD-(D/E)XK nuclease superfamily protein [Dyadobacter jejuensis]
MQSFLNRVAQHIYSRHPQTLGNVGVVVPTRRSAFFLLQELSKVTQEAILSPDVLAIDDFVESATNLRIEDPVHLMLELYEAYKEIDPQLTFERFMGWAAVLMSDLDKIDQYLVDTRYLFDYLSESKALERWQMALPEGKTLESQGGTKQYFALFENLQELYLKFRERLTLQGKAYRGMIYRQLAQNPDFDLKANQKYERIYFVGFNAFTEAEKSIIQSLVKQNLAEVLWDTDSYYMRLNEGMEAGKILRDYQQSGKFGPWNWTTDHLTTSSKNITFYGVPNNTLQTKVAGQLYVDMLLADEPENPIPTAIVLADENLLVPMLHSLDPCIKDLNVTMGLSMKNSLLYTLIDSIFELQENTISIKTKDARVVNIPKFNHQSIDKVLNHPFIRHYENKVLRKEGVSLTVVQDTLHYIENFNKVYLSAEELIELGQQDPMFQILFTHWNKKNPQQVLDTFYGLIDLLRVVYKDYSNALETEYLYLFYTLLKRFEQTIAERPEILTFRTLRGFLYELIRQTAIPFSGEPISNLQILGMLETRALDFERVIIISANEGILPKAKRQNSLIPHEASQAVGLPTQLHQEAVMSYHFYRLLQRAKDVHLLYVNTATANSTGEKSRFLQQIEFELSLYNQEITLSHRSVRFEGKEVPEVDTAIEKDPQLIQAIRAYLGGKGLYPTHLNTLIRCSMQFYLTHIVGVQEKREVEEELGMDKIGTWLHESMETIDREYFIKEQDPSEAEIRQVLRAKFEERFSGYITDQGLNRIYYQIGEQQVLRFLKHQMEQQPRRKVVATEQALRTQIELVLQGEVTKVNLGGKIDRIELDDQQKLLVMDYKTGSVQIAKGTKLNDSELQDNILTTDGDLKMGYVRQLWMYEYLVYRKMLEENGLRLGKDSYNMDQNRVQSGFYSFRTPTDLIANPLILTGTEGNAQEFMKKSEELLKDILDRLLDPDIPFSKTDDLNICQYCDFKGICGR